MKIYDIEGRCGSVDGLIAEPSTLEEFKHVLLVLSLAGVKSVGAHGNLPAPAEHVMLSGEMSIGDLAEEFSSHCLDKNAIEAWSIGLDADLVAELFPALAGLGETGR